ncbi:MAG TPA: MOSC domain-containing protein [Cyclobacteriaceae bacterium]|nr:MOSC domain-containing protein [Cyclobacteriaceae bacterium]
MASLILAEIWIYPIKSLGGIRLASSRVMPKGLAWDRRWMLVDENGKFLTQRTHPALSAFKLRPLEGGFRVTHDKSSMDLMHDQVPGGPVMAASIWDDQVTVQEVGDGYNKWFTSHAGFPCRLVAFAEENPRPVDPRYAVGENHVSLADGYPILVIGMESLNDLNQRLPVPVPMNRFRPNLIFTGGKPYEEDNWRTFRIGQSRFVGVKPCGRCVFTTIDQQTGKMGSEPLATLSRYRKFDGKVNFGQNVIPLDHEVIQEGDEINQE